MKGINKITVAVLVAGLGFTGSSSASLFDRGGGLLYDDVLNVTWLQDANYAKTSGYSTTGQMDWNQANTWATNLNYNGLTGWRLATNTPINGNSFNYNFSYDGKAEIGYNITSPNSELAYMYHVNLGLTDQYSINGDVQSNFGIFGNGTTIGQANVGLVKNLQSYAYWSGADYASFLPDYAWVFLTMNGYQNGGQKLPSHYYAWAVRAGDVAAVPVPAAIWFFTSGLSLFAFGRRRKAQG
jgi:hypothetical protein